MYGLSTGAGEETGACGKGLNDCLTLLYPPAVVMSGRLVSSLAEVRVGDMSLMPRLWPAPYGWYALEVEDDIVLVRLGGKGFEADEYVEELVEAFEAV